MNNASAVSAFALSGLNESRSLRWALFFLSLSCYCFIILVNACVILTVVLDSSLHEPMYILLCAFCLNALYGTTGFFPKFLFDLLSPVHSISYSGCLLQAQVMYSFPCSDLSILSLMAYDRYLAICRPLRYRSVMSRQRALTSAGLAWAMPFGVMALNVFLTSRLKLCSSRINRLFCVNWSIVALACCPAEASVNSAVAYATILLYLLHCFFIVWSYMDLVRTCARSLESRAKFTQTCAPHLFSLLTFTVGILFDLMYMRFGSRNLPQPLENFIAIEFLVVPPVVNPLVYGFKLTKIRRKFLKY